MWFHPSLYFCRALLSRPEVFFLFYDCFVEFSVCVGGGAVKTGLVLK